MSDEQNTRDERGRFRPGIDPPNKFKPGNRVASHKRNSFHLKSLLRQKLAEVSPDNRRTFADLFVEQELKRGVQRGGDSAKRIWEYIEGKPMQPVDVTSNGDDLFASLADVLKRLTDADYKDRPDS